MRVNLFMHDEKPRVRVLGNTGEGPEGRFINVDFGPDLVLSMQGYGAECAAFTRAFATALLQAADVIETPDVTGEDIVSLDVTVTV